MPKLSVIIPVYNVELYLGECIDSILFQTFSDFEVIIVNDGSTDSSSSIISNYTSDTRIKSIYQANMGLPEARNTGIKYSSGKYIIFIDSDDRIRKDMFETMIREIESSNTQLVICNIARFDKIRTIDSKRYTDSLLDFNNKSSDIFYSLAIDSCCNKLFRLDIIKKKEIVFSDKKIVPQEDFFFNFKYLCHINRIRMISDTFYEYRIRQSSITNSKQDKFIQGSINFVHSVELYHNENKISRDYNRFSLFLLSEMLQASINNSNTNYNEVLKIIQIFNKEKRFKDSIRYRLSSDHNLFNHSLYYKSIYYLYLMNLSKLVTIFEYIRVKRLKKNQLSYSYR